jgi:hypothetical protein
VLILAFAADGVLALMVVGEFVDRDWMLAGAWHDAAPFVAEVKARKNGSGFTQLEKWLGDYQVLFLRRDRADPLVVLPWSTWAALLEKARR